MFVAVAYDVSDDKRRLKVARVLEGYLIRVQKSVFEGHLAEHQLQRLQARLARIVEPNEDSVRIYRLCRECRRLTAVVCGPGLTEEMRVVIL